MMSSRNQGLDVFRASDQSFDEAWLRKGDERIIIEEDQVFAAGACEEVATLQLHADVTMPVTDSDDEASPPFSTLSSREPRMKLDLNDPYGLSAYTGLASLRVSKHLMDRKTIGNDCQAETVVNTDTVFIGERSKSPRRPGRKRLEKCHSEKALRVSGLAGGWENDDNCFRDFVLTEHDDKAGKDHDASASSPELIHAKGKSPSTKRTTLASLRTSKHLMAPSHNRHGSGENSVNTSTSVLSNSPIRRGRRRMEKSHSEKALRVSLIAGGKDDEDDYGYGNMEDYEQGMDRTLSPKIRQPRLVLDTRDPFGAANLASLRVSKPLMAPSHRRHRSDASVLTAASNETSARASSKSPVRHGGRRIDKSHSQKTMRVSGAVAKNGDEDDATVDTLTKDNATRRRMAVDITDPRGAKFASDRISKHLNAQTRKGQHESNHHGNALSPTRQARRRMEKCDAKMQVEDSFDDAGSFSVNELNQRSDSAIGTGKRTSSRPQRFDMDATDASKHLMAPSRPSSRPSRLDLDATDASKHLMAPLRPSPHHRRLDLDATDESKHLMAPSRGAGARNVVQRTQRSLSPQRPGRRRAPKQRSERVRRVSIIAGGLGDDDGDDNHEDVGYIMEEDDVDAQLSTENKSQIAPPHLTRVLSDRPVGLMRENGKHVRAFLRNLAFTKKDAMA
ncbi:hypothetical protein MPSEU_000000600 [Mayamaea pseudoterrestris]|nr:hypothetical protein MPSEU_000000600 [Mayamaea pseudoterrestris]